MFNVAKAVGDPHYSLCLDLSVIYLFITYNYTALQWITKALWNS